MAEVIITIESNWDHLTDDQQDCLSRIYAQALIKFTYEMINKEKQPSEPK